MAIRSGFIQRHGKMDGPVIKSTPGQSTADGYAKGGDMKATIAGSPDTIAERNASPTLFIRLPSTQTFFTTSTFRTPVG